MVWGSKAEEPAHTGRPGDLSPEQEKALDEMREQVADISDPELDPGVTGIDFESMPPDNVLLRFLRARKFDVPKAFSMLMDCAKWRADYGTDQILNSFRLQDDHRRSLEETYQFGYHNCDKEGRPVYIDRVGGVNWERLLVEVPQNVLLRLHVQEWEVCLEEKFPACTKEQGRLIETNFSIIDLEGLNLSDAWNKKVQAALKDMSAVDSANYPEIMGKLFIINAPFMFKPVWAVISKFLDPKTVGKIKVLGSNYLPTLLEYIDQDKLPHFLGGTCRCEGGCLQASPGPWNKYPLSVKRERHFVPQLIGGKAGEWATMGDSQDPNQSEGFFTPATTPRSSFADTTPGSPKESRQKRREAKMRQQEEEKQAAEAEASKGCFSWMCCCCDSKPSPPTDGQTTPPLAVEEVEERQTTPMATATDAPDPDAFHLDELQTPCGDFDSPSGAGVGRERFTTADNTPPEGKSN